MKSLVIGASGLVGWHIFNQLQMMGEETIGTFHSFPVSGLKVLDMSNIAELSEKIMRWDPTVIYLPAANSNVERCEESPEISYQINMKAIEIIGRLAAKKAAILVFFSSDYIFDGEFGPYREDAKPNPLNNYGLQKLSAEKYIQTIDNLSYLIIRTTWVYGYEFQRKNFVYRVLSTLSEGKELKVPSDQMGNPTYAKNLVEITIDLVQLKKFGIYNIAGPERLSRDSFANLISQTFNMDSKLIHPVDTLHLHQIAKRPLQGGLIMDKIQKTSSIPIIGPKQGLLQMKGEMNNYA